MKSTKKTQRQWSKTKKIYQIFVLLRILLVFIPQLGYIHPDEFFQNIEVLASRTFEIEASLPWEFNVTTPIRSMGVTYFTMGLCYQTLKTANYFIGNYLQKSLVTPYTLLILPRLLMCVLSFFMDHFLMVICKKNNENYHARLLILSTSYVTLVYCTRTFSNTLEVFIFTLLLHYVADSLIFSNIILKQREYLNKRYENSETPAQRAKFHKLRLLVAQDSYRNCFQVSTLCVLGFFNRPTFVFYAVFPVFFWLYRGIGYKSVQPLQFNIRILVLIIMSLPTIVVMVIVDSFFYGYITWGEIGMLDVSIESFTFPPWNFIKYNLNADNLAQHGLHPRYLNLLVNVPLLFNVLGIFAIFGLLDLVYKLANGKLHLLPTVRSIKGLMTMSFLAPFALLSIFPHQEPRFLIPIITPLVYLHAQNIYSEENTDLVHVPKASVALKDSNNCRKPKGKSSNFLFKIWLCINLILTVFYGFVHQGGVYRATKYLSEEINSKPHLNYHIVTSHIYSIPHIFFTLPSSERLFRYKNSKYNIDKFVFTYEKGSLDMKLLISEMSNILQSTVSHRKRSKVYLLLPGSRHDDLMFESGYFRENSTKVLNVEYKEAFFPHLSTEALPDFSEIVHVLSGTNLKYINVWKSFDAFHRVFSSFDLRLYEITMQHSNSL